MMLNKKSACILLSAVALTACKGQSTASGHYACDRGIMIDATFKNGETVELHLNGKIFTLPRDTSASGAKYKTEDGMLFWSKGVEAQFIAGTNQKPINCRRQ